MKALKIIIPLVVIILIIVGAYFLFFSKTVETNDNEQIKMTAEEITNKLKEKGLNIGKIVVYTEETDLNNLLGRPNQYTSKATFEDTRINQEFADENEPIGGTVEVFANSKDAQSRKDYVESISSSASMFSQYIYLNDYALLRLENEITPTQAKEYEIAFNEIMSNKNTDITSAQIDNTIASVEEQKQQANENIDSNINQQATSKISTDNSTHKQEANKNTQQTSTSSTTNINKQSSSTIQSNKPIEQPKSSNTTQTNKPIEQPKSNVTTETKPSETVNIQNKYQSILNEYSTKLKNKTPSLITEYKNEASKNTSGLNGLATICNNKVSELAKISNEGIGKMADIYLKYGSGKYSEYESWAGKIQDVYMKEAGKIQDAYMNSAMNN